MRFLFTNEMILDDLIPVLITELNNNGFKVEVLGSASVDICMHISATQDCELSNIYIHNTYITLDREIPSIIKLLRQYGI